MILDDLRLEYRNPHDAPEELTARCGDVWDRLARMWAGCFLGCFSGDPHNGRPENSEVLQALQVESPGSTPRNESRPSPAVVARDLFDLGPDLAPVSHQNRWLEMPDLWFKMLT